MDRGRHPGRGPHGRADPRTSSGSTRRSSGRWRRAPGRRRPQPPNKPAPDLAVRRADGSAIIGRCGSPTSRSSGISRGGSSRSEHLAVRERRRGLADGRAPRARRRRDRGALGGPPPRLHGVDRPSAAAGARSRRCTSTIDAGRRPRLRRRRGGDLLPLSNALLGPGDHVIVTWPGYQTLYEVARAAGAEVEAARAPRGGRLVARRRSADRHRSSPRRGWSSSTRRTTRPGCCPTRGRVARALTAEIAAAAGSASWPTRSTGSSSTTRPTLPAGADRSSAASRSASCRSRSRWPGCGSAGWRRATARARALRAPQGLHDDLLVGAVRGARAHRPAGAGPRARAVARSSRRTSRHLDAFFADAPTASRWVRPRGGSTGFPRLARRRRRSTRSPRGWSRRGRAAPAGRSSGSRATTSASGSAGGSAGRAGRPRAVPRSPRGARLTGSDRPVTRPRPGHRGPASPGASCGRSGSPCCADATDDRAGLSRPARGSIMALVPARHDHPCRPGSRSAPGPRRNPPDGHRPDRPPFPPCDPRRKLSAAPVRFWPTRSAGPRRWPPRTATRSSWATARR